MRVVVVRRATQESKTLKLRDRRETAAEYADKTTDWELLDLALAAADHQR